MVLIALRISITRIFVLITPQQNSWSSLYSVVFRSQLLHQKCVGSKDPAEGMRKISSVKGIQQAWQDCGRETGQRREGGTEQLRNDQEP